MPTQIDGSTGVPASALPFLVGQVIFTAGSVAPSGFLKCNGAAVSRITYAALFTVCGTIYGAGDGSTTFNLPDLRGEFIRGWDDGRGVDSARVLGSAQAGGNEQHYHVSGLSIDTTWVTRYGVQTGLGSTAISNDGSGGTSTLGYAEKTSTVGGAEARPRNIALLACIFTGANQ